MKILCVFGRHAYGDPSRGEGYEHANFLPALSGLGHEVGLFDSWDRTGYGDFAALNRAFLARLSAEQPDVVLCVLMGYELWVETLQVARRRSGAVLINWGTDDSWKYDQFARFVAPWLDCYATTCRDVLARARSDGLHNFLLSQWAASDATLAAPLPAEACKFRVSFVGSAYGNRRAAVEALRRRGIEVTCFGHGWDQGPVAAAEIPRIIRESMVSLNFADSATHLSGLRLDRSRQLKARVFEVPGAGGFLLTETAPSLADYYRAGEEIETFDSHDELADKIRHYLDRPGERDRVAQAGHERTRREHTYSRRFAELIDEALRMARQPAPADAEEAFHRACARHTLTPPLRLLRTLLERPARLVFGREHGPRAARRLLFELSWRLAGARTYSAGGWPGRLFYRES